MVVEKHRFGGTDRLSWSYVTMSADVVPWPWRLDARKQRMSADVVPWPWRLDARKQRMKKRKRKPRSPVALDPKPSTGATEKDRIMRWVEQKRLQSAAQPAAPSSGPAMVMPYRAKMKARGRLTRAVLAMLGKGLEDCFDEVRKQEVPERFKSLLQQF
jgi:cell division septation protein DedD